MGPKKRSQKSVAVALAALVGATSAPVRAGTWTGGASEWTQISNNIQLVLSYIEQVMMVVNLSKQLAIMIKMAKKSNSAAETFAIVTGFHQVLGTAAGIVFSGKAMTEQWKKSHPGEQTPEVQGYGSIEQAYDAIDNNMHDAAEQALRALDIHVDSKSTSQDQQIVEQLRTKMENAEGQMQAQQVTNELLLEVIRQLNLIRQVNVIQARMVALDASDEAQMRLYRSAVLQREYAYRGLYRGDAGGAPVGAGGGSAAGVGAPVGGTAAMPAAAPASGGSVLGNGPGAAPAPGSFSSGGSVLGSGPGAAPPPGSSSGGGSVLGNGPGAAPAPGSSSSGGSVLGNGPGAAPAPGSSSSGGSVLGNGPGAAPAPGSSGAGVSVLGTGPGAAPPPSTKSVSSSRKATAGGTRP